jgi:hypothetical protein
MRTLLAEQKSKANKVQRDAFLYMDHKGDPETFAQCGSCIMFTGTGCTIHSPDVKVSSDMSCGFYVHGEPELGKRGHEQKLVTPIESGLVKRQVRCENCSHVDSENKKCNLFAELNKLDPYKFNLKEEIDLYGCCNAQTPGK